MNRKILHKLLTNINIIWCGRKIQVNYDWKYKSAIGLKVWLISVYTIPFSVRMHTFMVLYIFLIPLKVKLLFWAKTTWNMDYVMYGDVRNRSICHTMVFRLMEHWTSKISMHMSSQSQFGNPFFYNKIIVHLVFSKYKKHF